jgi:hypothetical protein
MSAIVEWELTRCMMSWMSEPRRDVGMGQGWKVSCGGSRNMGKGCESH